ncbi:hypothetical protein E5F92_002690 [Flavobacterium columnare]|uniref:hypothetical protein n=1 Tax=Flavobacterium columnare TaxID=996 RepID=UPI00298A0461|nr:hypothetical protein [Flavobacterium columnare]MCH4831655.1 hypothetical protein [Flavobacterium columnare]
MPSEFPEVWLDQVIEDLNNTDQAPFFDGIPELDADVSEFGAGTATESNKIHVSTTDFDVDILINNNTYPIPVQVYDDGTLDFKLDKYQTKVITLSDDQTMGAAYDKIQVVTGKGVKKINSTKFAKGIHSIAPQSHTINTPVLAATGGPDNLQDATGRKRLTYEDLVNFKQALADAGMPTDDVRLVLCNNHWNDLLMDRKNFGNQLVDYVKGKPAPVILGFELFQYANMPRYTAAKVKKPYNSIPDSTDKTASVAFGKEELQKKQV